jgi:hypothetical protein
MGGGFGHPTENFFVQRKCEFCNAMYDKLLRNSIARKNFHFRPTKFLKIFSRATNTEMCQINIKQVIDTPFSGRRPSRPRHDEVVMPETSSPIAHSQLPIARRCEPIVNSKPESRSSGAVRFGLLCGELRIMESLQRRGGGAVHMVYIWI